MTKSCWLLFSFLNEMVNTSFQEEHLLISSAPPLFHILIFFRFPPLHPWSDKADRGVDQGFPSHVFAFTFHFYFFALFFVSAPAKWNACNCARTRNPCLDAWNFREELLVQLYLWILDWRGHEKMAPVEHFINGEPKLGGGGREFWVAASVTLSLFGLSMWLTGHGWSRTNGLWSAQHVTAKDTTWLTAGCISHCAVSWTSLVRTVCCHCTHWLV